jgi:DNA-binding CsgD family transcriptional regulator
MDHMPYMMSPEAPIAEELSWGGASRGAAVDSSILALLTQGLTDAEIAGRLGTNLWAVNRDVAALLRGMGILSRTPAVDAALRRGSLGRLAAGPDWRPVLVTGRAGS